MERQRQTEIRKIAIRGIRELAIAASTQGVRSRAFEHLANAAENWGDEDARNAIRYLASEGSEEISSASKKWLLRMDGI